MKGLGKVVGFALMLGLCSGCSDSHPAANAAPPASAAPVAAAAAPAEESAFAASGPIIVENEVEVTAQRAGVVVSLLADTGKAVRKGEVLARLDDRQLKADRDAAEARLHGIAADVKNWEAREKMDTVDFDRAEKMMAANLITKEQLDHARYTVVASQYEAERERQNLRNAQATLASLDLELEKTRVMAPFDGVVARRYVRAGQQVSKDDRLFWVTAVAPLRVKFTLPEKYFGRVKKADTVSVSVGGGAGRQYSAKVIEVSPVVDPASGTIEVLAELVGAPADLRPGMMANIRLENAR